jgi:hypothetical protein
MIGFGQIADPCRQLGPTGVRGPIDLRCGDKYNNIDPRCTPCLNEQNNMNALVRIDNPYMWTHRIVPGLIVGALVGVLIGRRMK